MPLPPVTENLCIDFWVLKSAAHKVTRHTEDQVPVPAGKAGYLIGQLDRTQESRAIRNKHLEACRLSDHHRVQLLDSSHLLKNL